MSVVSPTFMDHKMYPQLIHSNLTKLPITPCMDPTSVKLMILKIYISQEFFSPIVMPSRKTKANLGGEKNLPFKCAGTLQAQ